MFDFLLFIFAGCFAGVMSGLLGIGGGLVIVPTLTYIFSEHLHVSQDIVMHLASGTSLCIMIFTSISSVSSNSKKSQKAMTFFREILPFFVLGIIAGGILADFMSTYILKKVFGFVVLLVVIEMQFGRMISKSRIRANRKLDAVVSIIIGISSGLLGIGGAFLLIPYLSRKRMQMRTITKVSAFSSVTAGVVGTVVVVFTGMNEGGAHQAWSLGYVYLPAVVLATIPSMIFAKLSANQAEKISVRYLRSFFIVFLMITSWRMIW